MYLIWAVSPVSSAAPSYTPPVPFKTLRPQHQASQVRQISAMAASSPSPNAAVYKGSCHCGFVTYKATLDLVNPHPETGAVATKCNCSICLKTGMMLAIPSALTALTPADPAAELRYYTFHTAKVRHNFCPTCGVRCFFHGTYSMPDGSEIPFTRVNVLTLDGREDGGPVDLRSIKPLYIDMRTPDSWKKGLAKEPWEGGVW